MDQPNWYVVRLDPNVASTWHLWPLFEERVRGFMKNVMDMGEDEIRQEAIDARIRWTSSPALVLYVLVFDQDHRTVGHLAGEMVKRRGSNYLEILQYEIDPPHKAIYNGMMARLLEEIDEWANRLNALFPNNNKKFDSFEWTTTRHANAYVEYLKKGNRVAEKVRSVIKCKVGSV